MSEKRVAKEFDAKYFEDLKHGPSEWHQLIRNEHDLIMQLTPPRRDERILDVGCGKGRLGLFLLSQQPGIEMVFSDVTPETKKYLDGLTFVECSMTSMPFPDEYFDKIYCMHVIAHFAEGEQAIREAFRILKKGGTLMILTPNKLFVSIMRIASFLRFIPPFKFDSTAKWLYNKHSLRKLLEICNWTSISQSYFQKPPRQLPIEQLRAKLIAVAQK